MRRKILTTLWCGTAAAVAEKNDDLNTETVVKLFMAYLPSGHPALTQVPRTASDVVFSPVWGRAIDTNAVDVAAKQRFDLVGLPIFDSDDWANKLLVIRDGAECFGTERDVAVAIWDINDQDYRQAGERCVCSPLQHNGFSQIQFRPAVGKLGEGPGLRIDCMDAATFTREQQQAQQQEQQAQQAEQDESSPDDNPPDKSRRRKRRRGRSSQLQLSDDGWPKWMNKWLPTDVSAWHNKIMRRIEDFHKNLNTRQPARQFLSSATAVSSRNPRGYEASRTAEEKQFSRSTWRIDSQRDSTAGLTLLRDSEAWKWIAALPLELGKYAEADGTSLFVANGEQCLSATQRPEVITKIGLTTMGQGGTCAIDLEGECSCWTKSLPAKSLTKLRCDYLRLWRVQWQGESTADEDCGPLIERVQRWEVELNQQQYNNAMAEPVDWAPLNSDTSESTENDPYGKDVLSD